MAGSPGTVSGLVGGEGHGERAAAAREDGSARAHDVAVLIHHVGLDAVAADERGVDLDAEARLSSGGLQRAHDHRLPGVENVDEDAAIVGRLDVDLRRVADPVEGLVGSDDEVLLARLHVEVERLAGRATRARSP